MSDHVFWQTTKIIKEDRYQLNSHKSCVIWLTGLSASGKSTLSIELEKELYDRRIRSYVLDGDNIRQGLNKNLGFSETDRKENIRRVGEVAKLFADSGLVTITAFISPYQADRDMVRALFAENEFLEIFVKCSLEECERRDPKGLYKKARAGIIPDFTGISAPYEEPDNPNLVIETEHSTSAQSVKKIIDFLMDKGYIGGSFEEDK
ncbi:adenylyl-sulfate kinase [Paenibacillus solisilvae]|uniref:Adenylyl-sulfate kinase n=1 Tax=Paenibacillus solisilvae TaxID=2486751 RepID=A0ABW0VZ87_9BACL